MEWVALIVVVAVIWMAIAGGGKGKATVRPTDTRVTPGSKSDASSRRPSPPSEHVPQNRPIYRSDYVPKEDEARYMTRDENGLPALRLVDASDRLAIWSPLDGGALINPKGPGLRSLGLVTSTARGVTYYPAEYRAADLRHGQLVELVPEPDNPHDPNAIALHAPGATSRYGHVQRGRTKAVHRILEAGPAAAVSLAGPAPGRDDGLVNRVLIGPAADIEAMLGN